MDLDGLTSKSGAGRPYFTKCNRKSTIQSRAPALVEYVGVLDKGVLGGALFGWGSPLIAAARTLTNQPSKWSASPPEREAAPAALR